MPWNHSQHQHAHLLTWHYICRHSKSGWVNDFWCVDPTSWGEGITSRITSKKSLFICLFNITQAPRTSRASLVKGRSQANAVAQQALIAHWQSIVKSLDNFLKTMKANFVSSAVSPRMSVIVFFDGTVIFSNMLWLHRCPHSWSVKCSLRYSHSSMFSYSTGRCVQSLSLFHCI